MGANTVTYGVAVDPPGVTVAGIGVIVAITVPGVPKVGKRVAVRGVPTVGVLGVTGVDGVVVPLAMPVAAIAV